MTLSNTSPFKGQTKAWSFGPRFFVLAKRRIYGMKLEFEGAIKNREYDVYESLESTVN